MPKRILPVVLVFLSLVLFAGLALSMYFARQQRQTITSQAQTYLSGFSEFLVVSGLRQPTTMEFLPDGRILVAEKGGNLRVVKNGALLPQSFLQVSVKTDGERGLLGVAVDPEFNTNRFVYIYYTDSGRSVNRVVRYTADASNPDIAAGGSQSVILDNIPSQAGYHNGGALHFGPDGKLYIAVGEGHTPSNSQSLNTIAGKLLRINKDGSIPEDNPFYQSTTGVNRSIWAYGLRNPFTFAINSTNGKIFVNDVGGGSFEEINDIQKGGNYGWPTCEGTCNRGFLNPIHAYGRNVGRAITGGVFYNGGNYPPEYSGNYFFADYLGNWIKKLNPANNQVANFVTGLSSPVDLRVGANGQIYYLSYSKGSIYRIQYGTGTNPTRAVTSVPEATSIQAVINIPADGAKYNAGDNINYEGTATDSRDGLIPASAFRWKVETVHNDHTHPFADWSTGSKTGSFKTGVTGEAEPSIKYRIFLSVTNSRNETKEVVRDVLPNTAVMDFVSEPNGIELTIDGQPRKTPFAVEGVVGFEREIGAKSTVEIDGRTFTFDSWSDGGQAVHKIKTPANKTTYRAIYKEGVLVPSFNCLGPCVPSVTPTRVPASGGVTLVPVASVSPTIFVKSSVTPIINEVISPTFSITGTAPSSNDMPRDTAGQLDNRGLIVILLELIIKILEFMSRLFNIRT